MLYGELIDWMSVLKCTTPRICVPVRLLLEGYRSSHVWCGVLVIGAEDVVEAFHVDVSAYVVGQHVVLALVEFVGAFILYVMLQQLFASMSGSLVQQHGGEGRIVEYSVNIRSHTGTHSAAFRSAVIEAEKGLYIVSGCGVCLGASLVYFIALAALRSLPFMRAEVEVYLTGYLVGLHGCVYGEQSETVYLCGCSFHSIGVGDGEPEHLVASAYTQNGCSVLVCLPDGLCRL